MKQQYRVRDGLVLPLSESKIYEPGEAVSLSHDEFVRHAHQVETEEQYQARIKSRGMRPHAYELESNSSSVGGKKSK